jgi:hypothetical protein
VKLFEIFNKIAQYNWIAEDDNIGEAEFSISGYDYSIMFEKLPATHLQPERWSVEFAQITKDKHGYESPSVDMTKTGHSFEVMGTVRTIIIDWFSNHPTKCVVISAAIPSRQRLYIDMIKQIFPRWEVQQRGHLILAKSPD